MIAEHPKVQNFGLCNFDSQRQDELIEAGVKIVSNQVQVYQSDEFVLEFADVFASSPSSIYDRRSRWQQVVRSTTSSC